MTKIERDLFDLWVDGGLSEPSLKALENRRYLDCTQLNTIAHNCTKLYRDKYTKSITNNQQHRKTLYRKM